MTISNVFDNGGVIGNPMSFGNTTSYTNSNQTVTQNIQYVGGSTTTALGGTANISVALTGLTGGIATAPAAGDIVIIAVSIGAVTSKTYRISTYTQIASLYANDTYDANLQVGWKRMGSTPDTTATITGGSGVSTDGMAIAVHVWRNVDSVTPIDSTPVTAAVLNTAIPAFGAVTPTTSGAVIICAAGSGHIANAVTYTATSLSNFLTAVGNDSYDGTVGMGSISNWTPQDGATYTPLAWTFGGTNSTSYAYCSVVFALRPATASVPLYLNRKNSGIWNLNAPFETRSPVPSPVTSGLQLWLDAGDSNSYPGSGTTWTNLANPSFNATLTSTTYTTDAGGGIVFSSSSSYAGTSAGLNFSGGGFTISVWLKHNGIVNTQRTQRYFTLGSSPNEGPVLRHDSASTASLHGYLFDSGNVMRNLNIANQVYAGQYDNFVYRYNGTTFTLWNNGTLVGTLTATATLPTPAAFGISATAEWFNGNMYIVQYYNRGITDAEITQNFNAFRGRFNL
jgi:hypothetical protein